MPPKIETKKSNGSRQAKDAVKTPVKGTAAKSSAPKISVSGKAVREAKNAAPKVEAIRSALKAQVPSDITDEMISKRAYQIWQEEGCPHGRSGEHWSRAEFELKQQ